MDEMLTMRPHRARIMPDMMAARVVANTDMRSMRITSSQSGGDIWISSLSRTAPALLTSTSTRPIALTMASTWARPPTSAWCAVAPGRAAAVSSAAARPDRQFTTTFAPIPARAWLMARPMPLPPPVTSAVLPSRSPMSGGRGIREIYEELLGVPGVHARNVLGSKAGQHATRTQLDHGLHVHRPHRDHGPRPVDLAQHLLAELVLQRDHGAHGLARGVGEDRDRRRRELKPIDHLAEGGGGARHQGRVSGQG